MKDIELDGLGFHFKSHDGEVPPTLLITCSFVF